MTVLKIHHVQLGMPAGGENEARIFYRDLLDIDEKEKPPHHTSEGVWFESGALKVHLGVEQEFRAAIKAHTCFEVSDLAAMATKLKDVGFDVIENDAPGYGERFYTSDPFGNRLEFVAISS